MSIQLDYLSSSVAILHRHACIFYGSAYGKLLAGFTFLAAQRMRALPSVHRCIVVTGLHPRWYSSITTEFFSHTALLSLSRRNHTSGIHPTVNASLHQLRASVPPVLLVTEIFKLLLLLWASAPPEFMLICIRVFSISLRSAFPSSFRILQTVAFSNLVIET